MRAPIPRDCHAVQLDAAAGVLWYHPVGAHENRRLDNWCRAVGPLAIDSTPDGSFRSSAPRDSLAVVSWNVDAGSGHLIAFLREELGLTCDGERSRLAGGAIDFVLLLQEAMRRSNDIPELAAGATIPPAVSERTHPGPRMDVLEVAAACGLSAFYAPAARNGMDARDGMREDKGNAILSTLPLSEFFVIELPFEASRRVVPVATVRTVRGDALRVASVHFITTPPPWRILTTGNSAHARQAIALNAALEAIERQGPTPTVVGSDTNATSARETALRFLRAEFPESPAPLGGGSRGPFPTDHLFFRRGASNASLPAISYRRAEDTYFSDHQAISAVVTFR
jgi:endonuclease/exonuclease/phosphatase family metal-dependent hydrolase